MRAYVYSGNEISDFSASGIPQFPSRECVCVCDSGEKERNDGTRWRRAGGAWRKRIYAQDDGGFAGICV